MLGRLVYVEPSPALDDIRFERIVRGFAQHYDVTSHSARSFSFARGEGYLRLDRWDAFGYVDGGHVERLTDNFPEDQEPVGDVVMMPPRFNALRFSFNLRVALAFWVFVLLCGWLLIGGDWMWWLIGLVIAYGMTISVVRRSVRAKLETWLVRASWDVSVVP
jgi:hypothetical protein